MKKEITELRTWQVPVTGWMFVLFFLACSLLAVIFRQWSWLIIFVPFILLGMPFIFMAYRIQIDDQRIQVKTLQGKYSLSWQEVSLITYGRGSMIFWAGNKKRLVVPAPRWWKRSDRKKGLEYMKKMIEKKQISTEMSFKSDFLFFKDTKK